MIGKPIKGRSFRGVVEYVAGRAGARLVGGNMEGRTPRELAREFGFSRALRPTLGKAVCHMPLRLPPGESLSVEQWNRVAERVIAWMGFADCSYATFLHPQSPAGEHMHIVACRVSHLGQVVDDSNDVERLMQIERRIERDYGLRVVPHHKAAARRPGRGEYQYRARTGLASEREALQRIVGEAAGPGVAVARFVAALERQGVEVRPAVTSTGRVTGVRFRRGEYTFSGSSLGGDFTWPGLLGRRGLAFEPARDLPALVAAGRRFDARTAAGESAARLTAALGSGPDEGGGAAQARAGPGRRGPPRLEGAPGRAAGREGLRRGPSRLDRALAGDAPGLADDPPPAADLLESAMPADPAEQSASSEMAPEVRLDTADQVTRQLAALGSPRYDLLIVHAPSGEHRHQRGGLTPEGVRAAIPWLKHLNANDCEILVRPSAPAGLTHFEGVPLPALRAARAAGFEPAAVVRAADGGREVWMRGGGDLPPAVQEAVDRELAGQMRPGRPPQTPGYGHLAGFTSPFMQQQRGMARAPFLTLEEASGRVYGRFRTLVSESRGRAAAREMERRVEREIAGLERAAPAARAAPGAEGGTGTPVRPAAAQAALRELLAVSDREAERLGLADPCRYSTPEEVDRCLARWSAARKAHVEAVVAAVETDSGAERGVDGYRREAQVVATFREREAARVAVAERLGVREVSAELPVAAARTLARWQASVAEAEERLEGLLVQGGARAEERLEAAVAVRSLREELADAAREHGLELRAGLSAGPAAWAGDGAELAVASDGEGSGPAAPEVTRAAVAAVAAVATGGDVAKAAEAALVGAARSAQAAGVGVARSAEAAEVGAAGSAEAARARAALSTARAESASDEILVAAYREAAVRRAAAGPGAGWLEQVAAELRLDEREASLRGQQVLLERARERAALHLDAVEPQLERQPGVEQRTAYATLVTSVLDLETRQAELAARIAVLADQRLGRDLRRLRQVLERQPTAELAGELSRLLEERRQLAPRLGAQGAGQAGAARQATPAARQAGSARQLAPVAERATAARGEVERAVRELLARPSRRAVEAVASACTELGRLEEAARHEAGERAVRLARGEVGKWGEALSEAATGEAGEAPDAERLGRLRRALDRYQAAESELASRLDAGESAGAAAAGGLGSTLLRLHRGDLSPDTLARLQRDLCRQLLARGEMPEPLAADPPARSLGDAIDAYEDRRQVLRAVAEEVRADTFGERPWLLRELREVAGGYQSSALDLERQVRAATRSPEGRALEPRYFLDHPAFAGKPHRAIAAWSAHAAERGVEPPRIAETLARSRQARTAGPRLLSARYGSIVAGAIGRLGLNIGRHLVHDP